MTRKKLRRHLGLADVYAISTGAMFSSGFFLLPGLAAAQTGSSVVLAYFIAGILALPALFSMAELSTAMPKAGGAYYFIDRALGPMAGSVGGLGSWVALVFKSAFALIGMGAYMAIFFDLPIKPLAVALTVVFCVVNFVGAKETSRLQRWLVGALIGTLTFFTAQGLFVSFAEPAALDRLTEITFLTDGFSGLAATVALVFVSYAGLTKVASVAEEVDDPDRNIPLGMLLSLATAMFFYCAGVLVMVALLDPAQLHSDLAPVATAAESFMTWLPGDGGLILVTIAAFAAFASTGNAGIMSASRYPLAMARDELMPKRLGKLSRFDTPMLAIVVTGGAMVVAIVALDVAVVAKMASAFQLILFGLINLAVVVMRESGLEGYRPGFKSPLYPYVQIAGTGVSVWLVWELGMMPALFSLGVVVVGVVWFFAYGKRRITRRGALGHLYGRAGWGDARRCERIEDELQGIFQDRASWGDAE